MRIPIITFCIAVTISACQNTTDGKGPPPEFSPYVEELYEQYRKETNPILFIVSADGAHANYVYCPDRADACLPSRGATREKTLQECEEQSGGVPCEVYAVGRSVVWKGKPVPSRASGISKASDYEICNYAIQMEGENATWEDSETWIYHVAEANRRNLTLENCTELLDGN